MNRKKTSAKKTSAKKPSAKKPSAKKTSAKKPSAKKPSAKKTSAKKTPSPLGTVGIRSDGGFELILVDFPAGELLEELGWQGGGHSWGAIAEALLELEGDEQVLDAIELDCEGDTFVAVSGVRAPLVKLSALLGEAAADRALLLKAIRVAEEQGTME